MIEFIKKVLSDNNEPSSKRIIAVLGSVIIFGLTIFFHNDIFVDASTLIILSALGITGAVSIFKK